MELKIWGKTIISVQKYLEKVTKAIDSLISKKALASAFVSAKNLMEQNADSVTNALIELSERKVNLINLNVICFQALQEIDRLSAKILILKFVDELPSAEIASLIGVSDRTFFRKLNLAYDHFEGWLKRNKFTKEYFEKKFKNEGWIMEVFYRNKERDDKKDIVEKDFINSVIHSLNKSNTKVCGNRNHSLYS